MKNEIILVGNSRDRRTEYFCRAAEGCGVSVRRYGWQQIKNMSEGMWREKLNGAVIKLDPPSYPFYALEQMKQEIKNYRELLAGLSGLDAIYLNPPGVISAALDKLQAKRKLKAAGVRTTALIGEDIRDTGQLVERMELLHCPSVFIKPRYFSGAAGIVALRRHPGTARMAAYTACRLDKDVLVNTKKVSILRNQQDILRLLDKLWELDCIAERWHAKSLLSGENGRRLSYDVRAVWQFGNVKHLLARTSGSPFTNLHISNGAMPIERAELTQEQLGQVEQLCGEAAEAFHGMHVCGMDILFDRKQRKEEQLPRMIEVNGQGDLLYDDIYQENKIYREQVLWMKKRL